MKIEAVIFDMDGVIIDSEPLYRIFQNKIFEDSGFTVHDAEYDTFIGFGLKKMWESLIASRKLTQPIEELIKNNNQKIYEYFRNYEKLEPMPGFLDFLEDCQRRKLKISIASSTARRVIEIIVKKIGISDKIPVVVSGEEVPTGKPAPDIFLEAARRMNLQPENCLVIEDSKNGVIAAKAAQMYCVGLQNPGSGNQNLTAANMIVDGFKAINLDYLL